MGLRNIDVTVGVIIIFRCFRLSRWLTVARWPVLGGESEAQGFQDFDLNLASNQGDLFPKNMQSDLLISGKLTGKDIPVTKIFFSLVNHVTESNIKEPIEMPHALINQSCVPPDLNRSSLLS